VLAILAPVAAASAAVAPVFTRTTAHAGDRVGLVQPVAIAKRVHRRTGIAVYLIPLAAAPPGVSDGPPPSSLARYRLGELVAGKDGLWRLWFRAPAVRPGRYTTLVWCRPCGGSAYPHGSVFAGGVIARSGVLQIQP
jgi:hypothetical protein